MRKRGVLRGRGPPCWNGILGAPAGDFRNRSKRCDTQATLPAATCRRRPAAAAALAAALPPIPGLHSHSTCPASISQSKSQGHGRLQGVQALPLQRDSAFRRRQGPLLNRTWPSHSRLQRLLLDLRAGRLRQARLGSCVQLLVAGHPRRWLPCTLAADCLLVAQPAAAWCPGHVALCFSKLGSWQSHTVH